MPKETVFRISNGGQKTEKENELLKAFVIDIINSSNDLMDMFILLREGR